MSTKRRELRMGILRIFEKHGALFTIKHEARPEDDVADLMAAMTTKKRKPKVEKKVDYAPLAYALADVCNIDFKANRPKLFAEAKRLAVATPTPTSHLVKLHYSRGGAWYQKDWRGQKGNRPTLGQVRLTWAQLVGEGAQGTREFTV